MTDERFSTISGLLNSPPRTRTPLQITEEPDTAPAPPANGPSEPTPTNPRVESRPRTTAPRSRSESSEGGTQRVAVRLQEPLYARLVAKVASTRSSQGDAVLDAIEAAYTADHLADLVAEAQTSDTSTLFARTKTRGRAEATVPVELRLRREAVAQIDRLVTDTHADSRTQLIVVALQAHLTASSP